MPRLLSFLAIYASLVLADVAELTCSLDGFEEIRDPALQEMAYDVGDGPQTTLVYVEPDIHTFYNEEDGNHPPVREKKTPKFNGFSGKFINMSNKAMTLYWESRPGGKRHVLHTHQPFMASATATFPGHRFFFTPADDPDTIVHRFVVGTYPENLYVYDPYTVEDNLQATAENLAALNEVEREKHQNWIKTLRFNDYYLKKTGRSYLAQHLRDPPLHFMWPASYFGQEHWVPTRETHFVQHPPDEIANQTITARGRQRILHDSDDRLLKEYRDPSSTDILNMTLKVISVVPRAFEIQNFLSPVEVEHILRLAQGYNLKASTTGQSSSGTDTRNTRTSKNSWVARERSAIVDAIYRRAADLQRMDESLMRLRDEGERPDIPGTRRMTEDLQLVHYNVGEQYTPHHDFGFGRTGDRHDNQGARFATLLLYLNDDMEGGATSFPRWANAETDAELRIEPQPGKAILFYSQLPDGNLDDFSLHAAMPVTEGEKWLINLWTWSPLYE